MTPERAEYHRLMLLVGFQEEYERELDQILKTENPITSPILELACCMSDLNQTISVLHNYVMPSCVDEQQVFDMVMTELRRRYSEKLVTTKELVDIMDRIARNCENSSDSLWDQLRYPSYQYELVEDNLLSEDVFNIAFEAKFLRGEELDIERLEREHRVQQVILKDTIVKFRKHSILLAECEIYTFLLTILCLFLFAENITLIIISVLLVMMVAFPFIFNEYIIVSQDKISCIRKNSVLWSLTWDKVIELKKSKRFRNPSIEIITSSDAEIANTDLYFQLGLTARKVLRIFQTKNLSSDL